MHYTDEMNAAWQPLPEALLDVADYAARITLRSRRLSPEDFEDARGYAVLRCWETVQRHADKKRRYFYAVAKYAILDWLNEQRTTTTECAFDGFEWFHAQPEPEENTLTLDVEQLRAYGEFTDDELVYLRYCMQGYNIHGIGQTMGVSRDAAYRCRRKLLPRLYRLAGQQMPPKSTRRSLTDLQYREVAEWRATGVTWPEIARRLECHVKAIRSAYRRYNERVARAAA